MTRVAEVDVLRQRDAHGILAPHFGAIGLVMSRAWDRFWGLNERTALADPIVRANIVSAFMRDEARRLLAPTPFQEVENFGEHVIWVWDGVLALRFKKLDADGLSRNLATQRALDFNRQVDLPGIPSKTPRVDAGYRLNRIETEVVEMLIVYRDGDHVVWDLPIPVPDATTITAIDVQEPAEERADDRSVRIRPRTPDREERISDPGTD